MGVTKWEGVVVGYPSTSVGYRVSCGYQITTQTFYDTLTNDHISQQKLSFHVCAGLTSKKGTSVMLFAYNFKKKRRCLDPMNREFGHSLFINMIRISMSYY